MMNANSQTTKDQIQPQKSNSTQNFNLNFESNESESEDDKTDSDFVLRRKKNAKRKTDKVKISANSFLPELPPYFFKGLRIFVILHKISQDEAQKANEVKLIKFALEKVGSIIVDDPNYSDLIITDEYLPKFTDNHNIRGSRQVLIDQIPWIKDFNPIQPNTNVIPMNNFFPNSNFKIPNRSVVSSPMVNNDTNLNHNFQIQQNPKQVTGLKIALPSNSTSPSATANPNFSCITNSSIINIMNFKSNSIGIYNNAAPNQSYIQRANSRNINDSYRKIQCLPIHPMIIVSDIRHLYAPLTKTFTSSDQIPRIYLEKAPRFYFLTPFEPVPSNAKQIAQSCKMQNKAHQTNSNLKVKTNDVAAVIGKSNKYCYICRTTFDDHIEHHNSVNHIRNTTPLWEEFDALALSFNEIEKEASLQ